MTVKQNNDPEGLRSFIEARCTHDEGHTLYSGPSTVELSFRKQRVPRAYWVLTYGSMPDGSFLVQTCDRPGCIDPDHWTPSRSPNEVLPLSTSKLVARKTTSVEVLLSILAVLERIEAKL